MRGILFSGVMALITMGGGRTRKDSRKCSAASAGVPGGRALQRRNQGRISEDQTRPLFRQFFFFFSSQTAAPVVG